MSLLNATVVCLQYAWPLYSYAQLALPFVSNNLVNSLKKSYTLSDPDSTTVVHPNVDTLYAATVYDLSRNNLILSIPEIDSNRYWSFAFYDPFGNNYATPGSVENTIAGKYLLRYLPGGTWGFFPGNFTEDSVRYEGVINSPTTDGTLLSRILIKDKGSDLRHVRSLVREIDLTTLSTNSTKLPSLTETLLEPYATSSDVPLVMLKLLASLSTDNPPFNITAQERESLDIALSECGIYDGDYHIPVGINLTSAYELAVASLNRPDSNKPLNNGWYYNYPQGLFGDDYVGRAITAEDGYLELIAEQAIYPRMNRAMNCTESYLYTFSRKPLTSISGFWSLTMYNAEGYLVENSLDQYEVGDRSLITYPDGARIYGDSSTEDRDGEFQVLVQASDIPPPSNWTSNWLPGPAGGGMCAITLRLYAPELELFNGSYQYPISTQVPAILA